jgi:hypothetical protein
MHKAGWNGKRSSPAMCLAWFVFERGHPLQPVLKCIRCRPREAIGADYKMPIFAPMTGDELQRTRLRRGRGHWWW